MIDVLRSLNLAFLVELGPGHDCLLHVLALAVIFDRRLESDFGLIVGMAPFVGRVGADQSLEPLHMASLNSFILRRLNSFVLLVTALLLGKRDSVHWDGTVFSLEMGRYSTPFPCPPRALPRNLPQLSSMIPQRLDVNVTF
jgi:hypothetical protein